MMVDGDEEMKLMVGAVVHTTFTWTFSLCWGTVHRLPMQIKITNNLVDEVPFKFQGLVWIWNVIYFYLLSMQTMSSTTETEEPAYLRDDPGLAFLTSQLERINEQIQCLDNVKKKIITEAEGQCRQDLASHSLDDSSSRKETISSSWHIMTRWAKRSRSSFAYELLCIRPIEAMHHRCVSN